MEKLYSLIPILIAIYWKVSVWIKKFSPIVEAIVEDMEERARDGIISKDDRKALATKFINIILEEKNIKLNFISRKILDILVDKIAQSLPDFKTK